MLHIPKIDDYLKILTDNERKDYVVEYFGEYFKSRKEKLCSKLCEKQNIRKLAELLYIFLTTPDEVEKYIELIWLNSSDECVCHYNNEILNLFDPELQLINTKPMIKDKFKKLLSELSSDNISLRIKKE